MKHENLSKNVHAHDVLSKLGCWVCAELKEYQHFLLKNLKPYECTRVCNLHAWAIANSAPAASVAKMFLDWMRDPKWQPAHPIPAACSICKRLKFEKEARLTEVLEELNRTQPDEWLRRRGMVCLRHSRKLLEKLPDHVRSYVQDAMSQKAKDLEQELGDFLQRVRKGEHSGGGILGRTAEYLVANRGIEF